MESSNVIIMEKKCLSGDGYQVTLNHFLTTFEVIFDVAQQLLKPKYKPLFKLSLSESNCMHSMILSLQTYQKMRQNFVQRRRLFWGVASI